MSTEQDATQEEAQEREAQELARLLAGVTSLADPLAWARRYWRGRTQDRYWRWRPPPPGIKPTAPNPDAYERGAPRARQALHRKDVTDA